MSGCYEDRFGGLGRLYGTDGLKRLRAASVCVVGVGGVGSWTVEALARSGIGSLSLIDLDDICVTNVNRQLPALDGQIGRSKVEVLAERIGLINPECAVQAHVEFFTERSASRLLEPGYDFVVDAIDKVAHKSLLLAQARGRGLPILSVGGAGGRRDASAVRVVDLSLAGQDELLKQTRFKLRREYGFPTGKTLNIPCVYSLEKPSYPWSDGRVCEVREEGASLQLDCASGFGSAVSVTGVFGFVAAGEVVRRIALEP